MTNIIDDEWQIPQFTNGAGDLSFVINQLSFVIEEDKS